MGIVRGGRKRCIAGTVILRVTIDLASVDLVLREQLLQGRMLGGTHGIQLIEVHQQVVGQGHLLIELVREVQVVQIVLAKRQGKEATQEGGLTTALGTD